MTLFGRAANRHFLCYTGFGRFDAEPLPPPLEPGPRGLGMTPSIAPLRVAVVVERIAAPTRWEDWRHRIAEVVLDDGRCGSAPRRLRDDGRWRARFFCPGGARPPLEVVSQFVGLYRDQFGVEPICNALQVAAVGGINRTGLPAPRTVSRLEPGEPASASVQFVPVEIEPAPPAAAVASARALAVVVRMRPRLPMPRRSTSR